MSILGFYIEPRLIANAVLVPAIFAPYRFGAVGQHAKIAILYEGKREFRPTWTEAVVPKARAVAPPVQVVAAPSVADELRKLAKLKEDGFLTDAEFEAQKRKLLGQ